MTTELLLFIFMPFIADPQLLTCYFTLYLVLAFNTLLCHSDHS